MGIEVHRIALEFEIDAPIAVVWDALLNKLPEWWPKDFVAVPGARMCFEPKAGGRLWEVAPDGGEILWGTVVLIKPSSALEIVGHLTQSYSGPALTMWSFTVRENGASTRLVLSDAIIGDVTDEIESNIRGGWTQLCTKGLKAFCES